ncbi:hypothetical protein VNO78_34509 [Psophocarpus tetragonolobus]|uniref:Uncharacterized protein n=1 Tax=Psophocarpus tetragonolobus TaxID=3891 RepID=A0AAN9RL07_PSOTE
MDGVIQAKSSHRGCITRLFIHYKLLKIPGLRECILPFCMGEVWVTTACLALIEAATSDYNSSGAWHRKGVLSSSGTSLARVKSHILSDSQGSETDVPHAYIWSLQLVPKSKGGCSRFHSSYFVFVVIVI